MILSKNYSRVVMSARKVKESLPGPALITVECYSAGGHGYKGSAEIPAGNPVTGGSASWNIIHLDQEELPELEGLVGKPVQIWTGDGGGSYHERWIKIFLIAPGLPVGFTQEARSPELVDEFPFRSIKRSCEELITRLSLNNGPYPEDFSSKLDVKETEGVPGEELGETPPLSIETPDKPKKGETSQQYWDRLRDEKIGKHHYKYPGD